MRYFIFLLGTIGILTSSYGQIRINNPYQNKDKSYIPDSDEEVPVPTNNSPQVIPGEPAIVNVITELFHRMEQSDGQGVASLFAANGRMLSVDTDGVLNEVSVERFANSISQSRRGSLREVIKNLKVQIDQQLASAWVDYEFFLDGKYHHCGVDAFQLHFDGQQWKIIQITDTRRDDCSVSTEEQAIAYTLDQWHEAATEARLEDYFSAFADNGIFLGTDPEERWTKDEFYAYAKPFFDKGRAWSFKATERNIAIDETGQMAWFDEVLETWMGPCRGSGVLILDEDKSWRIKQYSLAVLVPNKVMQDYIKLLNPR